MKKALEGFNYNAPGTKRQFTIIADDNFVLHDLLNNGKMSSVGKFRLVGFIYDEVNFALLESDDANDSEIFEFGCHYGAALQQARKDGKVE